MTSLCCLSAAGENDIMRHSEVSGTTELKQNKTLMSQAQLFSFFKKITYILLTIAVLVDAIVGRVAFWVLIDCKDVCSLNVRLEGSARSLIVKDRHKNDILHSC